MQKATKFMNKIKEDLNEWRDIAYSWIGRPDISKMSVLPNLTYRFNTTPIKTPASYLVDMDKLILKFIWRGKKTHSHNTVLKEKTKLEDELWLQDLL